MNRRIGDMTWPAPGEEMSDIEHALRYSYRPITLEVRMSAASIIGAYRQMIFDKKDKRQMVIRELRKGPDKGGECGIGGGGTGGPV